MSARLILNADDFGLTGGVNRAIAELHRAGALTSATLMATGPAFDDAIAIARDNPGLGVGCHVVLTDGAPLSPPHLIPTLLGSDGRNFRKSLPRFLLTALGGFLNPREIALEAQAQIERLQRAGVEVTHIDTHKHTHILPSVARPLLHAAERCGVRAIRNPFEPAWSRSPSRNPSRDNLIPGTPTRRLQIPSLQFRRLPVRRIEVRLIHQLRRRFLAIPQIRSGRVQTTDGTLGVSATGNLNSDTLQAILAAMPEGCWELVCHPGYNDRDLDAVTTRLRATREIERDALLAEIPKIFSLPNPPQLINYKHLQPAPTTGAG